jgi:hypothetical protein
VIPFGALENLNAVQTGDTGVPAVRSIGDSRAEHAKSVRRLQHGRQRLVSDASGSKKVMKKARPRSDALWRET